MRRFPWTSAAVVAGVMGFYAYWVDVRIHEHGVLWFVHLGHRFLLTSTASAVLRPSLGWQSPVGYDGQYYYALAVDPVHAHDYLGGSTGYIYSRALYPAVSRATALGSAHAIPYAMLAVNLVAVAAGTLAVALWLRARAAPVWPAALFALYPGLVFTVFRDLTEPLAFALAACAMLAFDERRPRRLVLSAALFALGALTRETIVPFALAAAAALVLADRRGRPWRSRRVWTRGVYFAVGACAPLLVWRATVAAVFHEPTQEAGHGAAWAVPFHGIFSYWPFDDQHRLIVWTVILPTVLVVAGAAVVFRSAPVLASLLVVNALLYVVFLPDGVDVDYNAASRAAIGVVLASLYCLPAAWTTRARRGAVVATGFVWSIGWYLVVAQLHGLSGIHLITQ